MELQFFSVKHPHTDRILRTVWLGALMCAFLSMLDWTRWIPLLLPGLVISLLPGKYRKTALLLCILWTLARWEALALLANRLFARSEAAQSYVYDYFPTGSAQPWEGVALLSCLLGGAAGLWGTPVLLGQTGLLGISIAYFGVSPGILWLAVLTAAAAVGVSAGKLSHALGIILVAALLFAFVHGLAPKPLEGVSALDERLRDGLAGHTVFFQYTPSPTQVPAPEKTPPPQETAQQPDRGISPQGKYALLLLLSAVTLLILFLPAVVKDRAEKKRAAIRAPLEDRDNAAAIRAMYLYARAWRELDDSPGEIPEEVEGIWLEAAYSTHTLTDAQRQVMAGFVREAAEKVWQNAGRKKRLLIQYRYAL